MSLIGIACPECGNEALEPCETDAEIGESVPVECLACGYETEGERRPVSDLFCDDPAHSPDCNCGADPDRAYESRAEDEGPF